MGQRERDEACNVRKEISAHWETPLQAGTEQSSGTSEGSVAASAWKTKWREFITEIRADQNSPVGHLFACPPQRVGAEGWRWGFRGRPQGEGWVDCWEDTLEGLVQHSWGRPGNSLGQSESREIFVAGPSSSLCSKSADHHLHKGQRQGGVRQWFATPEAAKPAGHQPPEKSTGEQEVGDCNLEPQRWAGWLAGWLLPRHTRVLEAGGKTLLQSLTSEWGVTGLKLLPVGLYRCRHSPHVPAVSAVPLTAPRPAEQVSPDKPLLSPLSCLGGEHMPEGGPPTETGPKPKLSTRGCVPKQQEGDLLAVTGSADYMPTISLRLWTSGATTAGARPVWPDHTAVPETHTEILREFPSRKTGWGSLCGKDTDNGGHGSNSYYHPLYADFHLFSFPYSSIIHFYYCFSIFYLHFPFLMLLLLCKLILLFSYC